MEILRVEEFKTKTEALKREKQIKGWRREKKINLITYGHPVLKSNDQGSFIKICQNTDSKKMSA